MVYGLSNPTHFFSHNVLVSLSLSSLTRRSLFLDLTRPSSSITTSINPFGSLLLGYRSQHINSSSLSSLPRRPNTEYHHYSSTSVVSTSFTCLWNTCSSKVSVIVEHLYYKSCSSKVSTKMMNNEDLLNSGGQSSTSASQTALVSSNHSKRTKRSTAWDYFTIEKDENGQERAYCKKCPKNYVWLPTKCVILVGFIAIL
ncbi:uncharacterized protein LOC106377048 isoform X1 [Brassica napus]|uniref:uncharacterized protein LOC106377048 isoform X1 n=1 Tax=Brassica napus TaxID=3708 RepID=UPI002079348F|nr:uncharacterized protein LOC106377048 isoform X1 [Brassica napus]